MATTGEDNVAQHIQRLSDIDTETLEMLMPIDGYEDMPLVPLDIAVEPLVSLVPAIHIHAYSAQERCKNPPADELTIDESASIMLYSMDWKPVDKSLYVILNDALRSTDRKKLEPWFLYLRLFLTALSRLPSTRREVYRGVKLDLTKEYPVGETIVWSGFSSCTTSINVLQSELFLGTTGPKTVFSITCHLGMDIRNHSYYSSGNEIVIFPPTQFKVIDCLNQGNDLHIIQLQEIQPCFSRLHAPVFSSISNTSSSKSTCNSNSIINHNTKWKQNGVTITEIYGGGLKSSCLYFPCGVYVDDDQTIYIADFGNNRIMAWKYGATTGQLVAGGNGRGNKMDQLDRPIDVIVDRKRNHIFIADLHNGRVVRWPCQNGTSGEIIISNIQCRGLAIDNNGDLYVADCDKNEVRRWKIGETSGVLVAGGNGEGNRLNQLHFPTSIVVDDDHSLYVFDFRNHRVMKWMKGVKEGIVVAGGGNGPIQLLSPHGLVVDHLSTVYVADWTAHRILRWCKGATQWDIIISSNKEIYDENQIHHPKDLSMDREGNLFVVEYYSHRLKRFDVEQS